MTYLEAELIRMREELEAMLVEARRLQAQAEAIEAGTRLGMQVRAEYFPFSAVKP